MPGRHDPSPLMKPVESAPDQLQTLARLAGDLGPIPPGLTTHKVLHESPVGPIKVREYATEPEARRMEALLESLQGVIAYPTLLGRWQNSLIFQYVATAEPAFPTGERNTYFHLGKFLGTLNAQPASEVSGSALDSEYAGWLDRLAGLDLLPASTSAGLQSLYRQIRPADLPVRLGYWDLMAHNFGWVEGRLTMLDEKHLRPSFPGVGLVKPAFLFARPDWQQVRAGYETAMPLTLFDEHRPFFELYYLVAALYFYSLVHVAGRVSLAQNPRFLAYRDRLIRTAAPGSWLARAIGEAHLYRAFPRQIPSLLRRRLGGLSTLPS